MSNPSLPPAPAPLLSLYPELRELSAEYIAFARVIADIEELRAGIHTYECIQFQKVEAVEWMVRRVKELKLVLTVDYQTLLDLLVVYGFRDNVLPTFDEMLLLRVGSPNASVSIKKDMTAEWNMP